MSRTEPSTRFYSYEYSRVKIRAAARGRTMADLARACGVSRQALEISLKGGAPNLDRQTAIATALGLKRDRLFAPLTIAEFVAAASWYAGLKTGQK
jgi:transcriptional regulator with XRE-family HTH domain